MMSLPVGLPLCCQRLMKQALDDSCARRWKHANKQGQRLELAYCERKLSQLLWLNRAAVTSVSFVVSCQVDHLSSVVALTGSVSLSMKGKNTVVKTKAAKLCVNPWSNN